MKVFSFCSADAVGEAGDLRLVLTQVDKDLKEYKEKVKALEKEKKEKIEEMVSKVTLYK